MCTLSVKASRNYALEAGWPWKLYGLHGKRYSKSSNGVEYIEKSADEMEFRRKLKLQIFPQRVQQELLLPVIRQRRLRSVSEKIIPTNCGAHLAESLFQTRSGFCAALRNLSGCFLSDGLEICSSMFAQRADEVIRELVTFVDVAAYFADEAFFAIGFWLRFYIFLIVGVSHGVKIVHDAGFGDAADEHSMGTKVYILFNLQRHKCINIFVQEYQSIIGTVDLLTCKFIYAASGLETKLLEYRERCIYRQAVYVENSSLFDHMVGSNLPY